MIGRMMVALAALSIGRVAAASAQEVWQADVRIQSLEVTGGRGSIAIRVVVTSDNDDDAMGVRLDLLLPVGAGVMRLAQGCRASPSPVANLAARVTCELGTIVVRGLREVTIAASTPPPGPGHKVAVVVMSDTPDPEPANNYAERMVP